MTLAFLRKDLLEQEEYPPCSEKVPYEDWETLNFKVLEIGDWVDIDDFNMKIEHPKTKQVLLVCSIDFDFMRD